MEEENMGKRFPGADLAFVAGIGSTGGGPDEFLVRRLRLEEFGSGGRRWNRKIPFPPTLLIPVPHGR